MNATRITLLWIYHNGYEAFIEKMDNVTELKAWIMAKLKMTKFGYNDKTVQGLRQVNWKQVLQICQGEADPKVI